MEVGGRSSESPVEASKSKSKTPRKPKDAQQLLKQKSPAEFFADNKNIAGFDNPGKCLYTTVRELVENALDSAEAIAELPIIEITIWSNYKINQTHDKIGVFVSIVSTKIPFKGTGKEYIGDDISEIATAVKTAIQQCCVQLKSKIVKRIQAREQQERKRSLNKYIPNATGAIYEVLKEMSHSHATKRRRYEGKDAELLKQVSTHIVTELTLREKLAQHVEQVDYEMALDYATQAGVNEEPREDIYIPPLEAEHVYTEFVGPVFVFRLVH